MSTSENIRLIARAPLYFDCYGLRDPQSGHMLQHRLLPLPLIQLLSKVHS